MEEEDEVVNLLRDRFRLSGISIAEVEAKRNDVHIQEHVSVCIADLAFKYAEHLAKDLQLFAWHARRKTVKMEDVIISTHRNENLAASARSFCDNLATKAPKSERRPRRSKLLITDDKAASSLDLEDQEQEDITPTD
ncbi:protein MHF1 homolog [Punica granatum]|uniref:Protein MHF1 homolog n=1 Tax=Punica granatum TaxID=22663 RepID=A0A218XRG7_PUNGR|nr:protein MHF1 homolog [Punica granatum]OWM86852.1 hypothetical protein CDL15_Pgr015888 [Punica granatum]